MYIRVHGPRAQYTAVYAVLYTAIYTNHVHGRVRAVYTCTRPCTPLVTGVSRQIKYD